MIQFNQDFFDAVQLYDNNFQLKALDASKKAILMAKDLVSNIKELNFLITLIDLTTLSSNDTDEKVQKLTEKALNPNFKNKDLQCAAICVYPARVKDAINFLKCAKKKINVASVAGGFPSGQYHLRSRLLEIELAIADGANEIDVVVNRSLIHNGDYEGLYFELKAMKEICGSVILKVILAVGDLECLKKIYLTSWVAMLAGADFLKTSTGKETVNATLEYAYVICRAVADYYTVKNRRVGFKVAGGIKTVEEALQYRCMVEKILGNTWLESNFFRIGASGLLDNIIEKIQTI